MTTKRGDQLPALILSIMVLSAFGQAGIARAQVQRFDFQPAAGPVEPGFTAVPPTLDYVRGSFGFTAPPGRAVDGTGFTWQIFGRTVTVEQAIPTAALSAATVDCVTTDLRRGTPFTFRTDLPNGDYDVTVWLGDVTTPTSQVRVTVGGIDVDVARMDVNGRRGTFDMADYGNAVPTVVRATVSDGSLEITVGAAPGSDMPITWDYLLDECPTVQPPEVRTADLASAFSFAGLQAVTLHPAVEPPLLGPEPLSIGSAPAAPELQAALDAYNAGDLAGARVGFEALADPSLRAAQAAGLFWIAGHPSWTEGERELLGVARQLLEAALFDGPDDWAAADLLLQVRLADDAERYRQALGYGGTPAAENMGRSCSITAAWPPEHPYYRKGQVLWLRNRGGLDPRRCSVSFEAAQDLAGSLDPAWGATNPHVHLYATDEWENDGNPWTSIDWGDLAGAGPEWARTLVRALNVNLDLSEWWVINRQLTDPVNPWGGTVGEIGGGWSDDVELVGLFGVMAYLLDGASDLSEDGAIRLVDGIWDYGTIDQERGFDSLYSDVEHAAESSGDSFGLYPMLRYGDPEGIERIMKNAKTVADTFLRTSPGGHRHFRGNHMSSTEIANNPDHRWDIPLCGRAAQPVPWLAWYSSIPAANAPLKDWTDAWLADAARTDKGKPVGIFPVAVSSETEELGPTATWYGASQPNGVLSTYPGYQSYLYNAAAFQYLRSGDAAYLAPFDAAVQHALAWDGAGRPALGAEPAPGQDAQWAGGKIRNAMRGALLTLRQAGGVSDPEWEDWLDTFATSYARFVIDPTDAASLQDTLVPVADTLTGTWPYRTTEGVMTDRIAVPGIADVVSYYLGADVYSVYYGLAAPQVTWKGTGRLFAAAVHEASGTGMAATTYLFADQPREAEIRLWGLDVGGEYELRGGRAPGLGRDAAVIDQTVAFTVAHRGDTVAFTLPSRTTYAVRIVQTAAGSPVVPPLPDAAIGRRDVSHDVGSGMLTVRLHDIGALDLVGAVVTAYEGTDATGPVIGSLSVPLVGAPTDLVPSWVDVSFPYTPGPGPAWVTVAVDPSNLIAEVTEVNNGVTVEVTGLVVDPPPPALLAIEPATAAPGETVRLVGRDFVDGLLVLSSESPAADLSLLFVNSETADVTIDAGAAQGLRLVSVENPDGSRSNILPLTVLIPDSVPPAEVSGLRVARAVRDLRLSWTVVTLDELGGPETISAYEIWRSPLPDFSDAVLLEETVALEILLSLQTIPGSPQNYNYRVRARDLAGNVGE